MNIQDISDFIDLVKNPDKFESKIKELKDEQTRLQAVRESVTKAADLDKEMKKVQKEKDLFEQKQKSDQESFNKQVQDKMIWLQVAQQEAIDLKKTNSLLKQKLKETEANLVVREQELSKKERQVEQKLVSLDEAILNQESLRKELESKLAAFKALVV